MRGKSFWRRRLMAATALGIATAFLVLGTASAASPNDTTWLDGVRAPSMLIANSAVHSHLIAAHGSAAGHLGF